MNVADQVPNGAETPSTEAKSVDQGPVEIVFDAHGGFKPIEPPAKTVETPAPKALEEAKEGETQETPPKEPQTESTEKPDGKVAGPKPGIQDRIGELTKARRDAEREAAYWKSRAQGVATANAPAPLVAPKAEDFKTPEEYQEALIDYKVEQKILKQNEKQAQDRVEQLQAQEADTVAKTWSERLAKARTEIPDYESVMENAEIPVAMHVADLLFNHEHGPVLAHHFALNPDKLEKLNSMNITKAAIEIARISSEVIKPAAVVPPAPSVSSSKKISDAPPPAQPVGAGRSTTVKTEDLPMDEYIAQRRKEGAAWAR